MPPIQQQPGARDKKRGTLSSRLGTAVLLLVLSFLAAEGALRFLLFHPSAKAMRWYEKLHDPALYADPFVEDVYWRLRWLFDEEGRGRTTAFDPLLGWTNEHIETATYVLAPPPNGEAQEAGQPSGDGAGTARPLLLYGAAYVANPDRGLAEALPGSPLADAFELVNYGINGQGIDQMYLLARETAARHTERRPVVVIAAVAGTDFERANMSFRIWPKPLLTPQADGLDIALPAPSVKAYMERNGYGVRSFAWRGLMHGTDWLPHKLRDRLAGGSGYRAAQRERTEAVLLGFRDLLEAEGIPYFFLVLHGPRSWNPERAATTLFTQGQPPPDGPLLAWLEREGLPHIDSRPFLGAVEGPVLAGTGKGTTLPTPAAYGALLRAIEAGVERYDPR